MPPTPDLSFTGLDKFINEPVVENCKAMSSKEEPKSNPQIDLQDQRVIDSGCSRHMTGKMFYLTENKEIDGGYVAFGGNPKGGNITRKRKAAHSLFLKKKMYCLVVTDDYSRFTWVFFLATKDETSDILKSFITRIENLVDHKVKVIRFDNETALNNKDTNQFCEMKGILRQFSVARTPQQNRVSEKRKRIIIEAARTMLADSKLPTTFWLEVVGTACYVQNRIKAFRVFNSRTRIVEENLHIRFSKNTPNVVGSRPDWLFDIDALTRSRNYDLIVAGTYFNGFAGTKASNNASQARKETYPVKDYILLPLWTVNLPFSQDPKSSHDDESKPSSDNGKKVDEDLIKENECKDHEKKDNVNSTNNVNTTGTNEDNKLLFDPNMPALEDINTFNFSSDDKDDGAMANMNNLDTTIQVSPTLTTIIHKDYPLDQMIKDLQTSILTRKMSNNLEEHRGKIDKTLFIKRHKGDILLAQVYVVDIIFGSTKKELCNAFERLMHKKVQMSSIGELTFFLGLQVKQKKDGIFISQDKYVYEILKKFRFTEVKNASTPMETENPLLKDEDDEKVNVHMYRSMIGSLMYLTSLRPDIMFALCACARYQVNPKVSHLQAVKKNFRCFKGQPKLGLWYPKDSPLDLVAYTDSDYAGASLDMKSTTGEFYGRTYILLGITSEAKEDGIFVSQDNYVAEILKKFRFTEVKTASTSMETQKHLLKDEDGEEVDVHMYRLMIVLLMYLTSSRPPIMFVACACSRYQVNLKVSHLHAVKRIFMYLKGQRKLGKAKKRVRLMMEKLFEMELEFMLFFSTAKAKTINREAQLHALVDGKEMIITKSSVRRYLQLADEEGIDCLPNSTIFEQLTLTGVSKFKDYFMECVMIQELDRSSSLVDRSSSLAVYDTYGCYSGPRCQEAMGDTTAQIRFESVSKHSNDSLLARGNTLRSDKDRHELNELMALCTNLQTKVLKLEKTKTSQDKEGLGEDASRQGRMIEDINAHEDITLVNVQNDKKMFDVDKDLDGEEVFFEQEVVADKEEINEVTLAKALVELKTLKPKAKWVVIQEPSESTTTTTIPKQKSQDKGKGIMVEEPVKSKKKDQIMLDEEAAKRLQVEFDEEERLAKLRAQKEQQANIALIET
nr:uncharacterized mitochondrial protein AtMg00810-like [Tanacetum cinerariifolium]